MKKLIAILTMIMFASSNLAFAMVDVPDTHWAINEIKDMVSNDIIPVDEQGYFNPEQTVFRTDFTTWLLKVLQQTEPQVVEEKPFTDVDSNTKGYKGILKSKEIGLVYGYPDGTFRPVKNLSKAETQSIMSHITTDLYDDLSQLEPFVDKDQIPYWDLNQYAKTIYLELFVNHPEATKLEPKKELTKAEAAVLLYKLKNSLDLVKNKFKKEEILRTEHLACDNCEVTITTTRKILNAGNIFPIAYAQALKSQSTAPGDPVSFVLDSDLVTVEGTLLLPKDTELTAEIQTVENPKWFNKNAKILLEVKEIKTPNGKVIPTRAIVHNKKDGYLSEGVKPTLTKVGGYALAGTIVGAGAGAGIGAGTHNMGTSIGAAIPVGFAVGTIGGLIAPGLHYKAKPGEKINIEILQETSIENE